MAIGKSGRIVLEVDPALKKALYVALMARETTMKDWFIDQATSYITEMEQPNLFDASVAEPDFGYASRRGTST